MTTNPPLDPGNPISLPRYCFLWNGELQIDGVSDGIPITPTLSTTATATTESGTLTNKKASVTTTLFTDASSSSSSNPSTTTTATTTNPSDKTSITAPLSALFHNYAPIKLYPGKRVLTEVRIKRVPVTYVDTRSIDANIELSATIENEERLYSGGIHLLRTLTCQYNRPGDDPLQPYLYIALEACDINLFDASEHSRKFSNFLLRNTIDTTSISKNGNKKFTINNISDEDNIMIPKVDHFEEDDAPLLLWRARRSVARQLLAGMTYLHRKGVFHGALKPTNVLIKNGIAKLAEISYYNLPGISPNNSTNNTMNNDNLNPSLNSSSTNPSPVLGAVSSTTKANNTNSLSSPLASVANTALAALRSATMNEWCPAPNPSDMEEETNIRNQLFNLPPHSPEIPSLTARLYALQSYRDTFAIGCLIYYVLTLGGHPFALRNNGNTSANSTGSAINIGGNTVLGSAAVTSSMSSSLAAVTVSPSITSINNGNLGYPSNSGSNNNNVALRNILRKVTVDPADVTAALARASLDAAAATAALALSLDASENERKKIAKLSTINTIDTTDMDTGKDVSGKSNNNRATSVEDDDDDDSVVDHSSNIVPSVTATPNSPFSLLEHASTKTNLSTLHHTDDDIVLPSSIDARSIPLDTPNAKNNHLNYSSDSEMISATVNEFPPKRRSSVSNLQINNHAIPAIMRTSSTRGLLRAASFHDIVPAPIEEFVPVLLGSEPRASHSFASSGVNVPMQVGISTPPGGPQKGITSGAWRSAAKKLLQQHHSQVNLTELTGTDSTVPTSVSKSLSSSTAPPTTSAYVLGPEDDNIVSIVVTTPSSVVNNTKSNTTSIPPLLLPEASATLIDPKSIIYVKNLPSSTTEKLLQDLFTPFGTIESVFLYNSIGSGKFRGTAKVCFTMTESAEKSLSLNGTEIKGNTITVELNRENATSLNAKVPLPSKVAPPTVPSSSSSTKPHLNETTTSDNYSTKDKLLTVSPIDDETPIGTLPRKSGNTVDNANAVRNRTYADRNVFHHVHYATLSDTTDHVEAADMVCSLLRPEHELRLTSSAALAHPVFWSATRKFLFITLVSEGTVVQQTIAKGRHAKLAASIQTAFLARLPPGCKEWSGLFPPPSGCGVQGWLNPLWPHRDPVSYEAVYSGPYSMYSLVRFVRNLYVHGQEHVRVGLFPSQQHLEAHVLSAFPWLVLELWKCDQRNGGRFTAQTLAGGTSRVVIGDTGIDAEYDISQSARTVRLVPEPGAAGERQVSSNDLESLDVEEKGKENGVNNGTTNPKPTSIRTNNRIKVDSDDEEEDNRRRLHSKMAPKHGSTLAAHLPPHIIAPTTTTLSTERGPGHRGGGGHITASNTTNVRLTQPQKQQVRKERLLKQQNLRLDNSTNHKNGDRTADRRRSTTSKGGSKDMNNHRTSDTENGNNTADEDFDFYVGDEDTDGNPFDNLVDDDDDEDKYNQNNDNDEEEGDIPFARNDRYHYNNMDNNYRQRKNNRSRSRSITDNN